MVRRQPRLCSKPDERFSDCEEVANQSKELATGRRLKFAPYLEVMFDRRNLRVVTGPRVLGIGAVPGKGRGQILNAFRKRPTFANQIYPIRVFAFKPQLFLCLTIGREALE